MKQFASALIGGMAAVLLFTGSVQAETVGQALRRGDAEAARAALSAEVAGRKDAGLHRAQLEGLIALRQGEPAKAMQIFRAILEVAPGFEPARLGLVKALEAAGQRGTAIVQARRLALQTEDQGLRDQLLSEVALAEGPKRGGVALRFGLLPSSNITGGADADTVLVGGVPFTLDLASRKAGGVGATVGATAWHRWSLGKEWTATASASVDLRLFNTALKADETDVGLRLDLSRQGPRGSVSFGPRFAMLFQDGDRARRQAGVGLNATYFASPRLRFFLSAEVLRQDFPQSSFRDGTRSSATVGLQWALSRETFLTVEVPMLRETAVAAHLAHKDLGLGIGLATQLRGGLNLGVSVFGGRNAYDGVYPGFTVARRDDVKSLRLRLSHDKVKIRGLVPELSVTRKWQASTIPLHDVTTTDVALSLSRRF
ncbi:MAG: surface lipoprotein assembly modifier [Rhodobacteraceae bacterium]|nr:surface lipoprotein assembly modifier [Paracoccaceae bacterium]MCF8515218.1 surface lipoprotein assembly modifier [Paracoccaceae bacterium]MCF8519598.1 surface lipoprotein assembly modifier [Paracoccaceae bacterium]